MWRPLNSKLLSNGLFFPQEVTTQILVHHYLLMSPNWVLISSPLYYWIDIERTFSSASDLYFLFIQHTSSHWYCSQKLPKYKFTTCVSVLEIHLRKLSTLCIHNQICYKKTSWTIFILVGFEWNIYYTKLTKHEYFYATINSFHYRLSEL